MEQKIINQNGKGLVLFNGPIRVNTKLKKWASLVDMKHEASENRMTESSFREIFENTVGAMNMYISETTLKKLSSKKFITIRR